MITGKEFKEIRNLKGLSLRDIAKCCNVSAQLIGQIENDQKAFTENNYKQIIDALYLATIAKTDSEINKKK